MTDPTPTVQVHIDPSFGPWIDREITPQMVRGKIMWITSNITRVRGELHTAEQQALAARHTAEDAFDQNIKTAMRQGAVSNAEAERTAKRLSREPKRVQERLDLQVRNLRDELDEMYRAQMPGMQSMNRIVMGEFQAEWAATGVQS